ncbi:MAG: ferritin family protein [Eubacteriales bacterium]
MEGFEFAIQMELDGENYYREQSERFAGSELQNIFTMLAEDEKKHGEILRSKAEDTSYTLEDSRIRMDAKNVFAGLGDFKSEIQKVPGQLDIYEMALEMEKKSIALYSGLFSKAEDAFSKKIFSYLIQQEEDHYAVLDELMQAVRNAISWVESAEFGIRKEY